MDMHVLYVEEPSYIAGDSTDTGHYGNDGRIALRDCLTANYDRLHRRLLRYLGCADLASDCLHDAWLKLGETDLPATVSHPEAYVYRVACNLALDHMRGGKVWQSLADFDDLDSLIDPLPGPDQIAEARSELAAVERAMQSLPYRCQSVLFGLRINDLTRHEVATQHGLSLRRVDTVLRQTLEHCVQYTSQQPSTDRRGTRRTLRDTRDVMPTRALLA